MKFAYLETTVFFIKDFQAHEHIIQEMIPLYGDDKSQYLGIFAHVRETTDLKIFEGPVIYTCPENILLNADVPGNLLERSRNPHLNFICLFIMVYFNGLAQDTIDRQCKTEEFDKDRHMVVHALSVMFTKVVINNADCVCKSSLSASLIMDTKNDGFLISPDKFFFQYNEYCRTYSVNKEKEGNLYSK
jgi:hypothetical protein